MTASKIVAAAASGVGGAGEDVDNLMNSFIYEGNGASRTITNDLDISGKGGLIWIKAYSTQVSYMVDTVRGANKWLRSHHTSVENTAQTDGVTGFTSSGYTVGADAAVGGVNYNNVKYCAWTFLKEPKFFDIVTWTGDGTANRNIAHNLASIPGHIMVKKRSGGSAAGWVNWHRTFTGDGKSVFLNTQEALYSGGSTNGVFGDASNMTSTHFQLGGSGNLTYINENGSTYVAFLFAHNNNDGGFGPDADQDIIKCGSYNGDNGSPSSLVNLGFEPQFLLIKNITSASTDWVMVDNANTIPHDQNTPYHKPNEAQTWAESTEYINIHPNGFKRQGSNATFNQLGETYIYIAIRRGPLSFHDDLTRSKVFSVESGYGSNHVMDFMADFQVHTRYTGGDNYVISRLTGDQYLLAQSTDQEGDSGTSTVWWDKNSRMVNLQTGWFSSASDMHSLNWRRVPNFCENVCYDGTGSNTTIAHNLGATPEMMWIRGRNVNESWIVYHKDVGATKYLMLDQTNQQATNSTRFNDTAPTASVFTVGTDASVNQSGKRYIAYLFATQDGISKIGSYTGNGSTQNIDCGFTNGCSFIMIKNATSSGGWKWHDSELGIASGNDPFLEFNNNNGYNTSFDLIDPLSSGFTVNNYSDWNGNGDTYIFYAVAA